MPLPLPRIPYAEALARYGTDRPDTRFGMELRPAGAAAEGTGFKVFDSALESGGEVRGIPVPGAGGASRKELDRWTEWAKSAGARGLIWVKWASSGEISSSALAGTASSRIVVTYW